jgi:hypothetical protein
MTEYSIFVAFFVTYSNGNKIHVEVKITSSFALTTCKEILFSVSVADGVKRNLFVPRVFIVMFATGAVFVL